MSLTSQNRAKSSPVPASPSVSYAAANTPVTAPATIRYKVSLLPHADVIIDEYDSKMYTMKNHRTEAVVYAYDDKNHPHELQRRFTLMLSPDISCNPLVWNNQVLFCHASEFHLGKRGIILNSFNFETEQLQTYRLDIDADFKKAELDAVSGKVIFKTAPQSNGEVQVVSFDWRDGSYQVVNANQSAAAKVDSKPQQAQALGEGLRHSFFYAKPVNAVLTCHDKNQWQEDPYNRAPEKPEDTSSCFGFLKK